MTRARSGKALETIAGPEAFAARFDVSCETIRKLERYESLLRRWQERVNLVAPSTLDAVWQRHFTDSAQLLALAPDVTTWLDLGAGAGFPGIVIAIMLPPDRQGRVQVVESNARKCAFMAEVVREAGCPVDIQHGRIESLAAAGALAAPGAVTARALAPLDRLLGLAAPFFGPETRGLFPKGAEAETELAEARETWDFAAKLHPSLTDGAGRIIELHAPVRRRREETGNVETRDGTR